MNSAPNSPDVMVVHPLDDQDASIVAAMRAAVSGAKGAIYGTAARGQYDAMMEGVAAPEGVSFERGTLGNVAGVWVRPGKPREEEAILYLHGGWFSLGAAWAYRFLVGQIVTRAGALAFAPDYRLAPEHPFPAAIDDTLACYRALAERGARRIAIAGDSAGGNLALSLASRVAGQSIAGARLVGVVALSPVTDLTLSGASYETRAEADHLFTRPQVTELVRTYLGAADAQHPLASPLYADVRGLPPVRIHVGDDEVLLDDALRYAERARAAGVDVRADVWMAMPHGFVANVGRLKAASAALDAVGAFLKQQGALQGSAKGP